MDSRNSLGHPDELKRGVGSSSVAESSDIDLNDGYNAQSVYTGSVSTWSEPSYLDSHDGYTTESVSAESMSTEAALDQGLFFQSRVPQTATTQAQAKMSNHLVSGMTSFDEKWFECPDMVLPGQPVDVAATLRAELADSKRATSKLKPMQRFRCAPHRETVFPLADQIQLDEAARTERQRQSSSILDRSPLTPLQLYIGYRGLVGATSSPRVFKRPRMRR
jgi:hypothetical protein